MVMLVLLFSVLTITLKLVNCLLEQSLLIFIVLLILFFLLLQEIKFTSPKSFVFFELSLNIRVHSLYFIILNFPLFDFVSNAKFTLRKSIIKLFILLNQLLII